VHAAACAYISASPTIVLAGPLIDKNGTPAGDVIVKGRYA